MDLILLISAFGGGVIGAALGALPSFIITGFLALSGGILAMAGVPEFSIAHITFGVYWGPHIAFTGAAAAAAVAAKRNKLDSAQNTLKPLYSTKDAVSLLSGGVFAIIGFLIFSLCTTKLAFLKTDAPAAGVFFTLLICRLLVGKTGPIGECTKGRDWKIENIGFHLLVGGAFGLVIGGAGYAMVQSGITEDALAIYPVVCFGIAALSLIFLQMGYEVPVTHHIAFPAAVGFVLSGSILLSVVVGAVDRKSVV